MKLEIRNRWSGGVKFTAEIDADDNTPLIVKIGLSVKWALKTGADLSRADLRGADLRGADLSRAENAELAFAQTSILPAGSLVGWKKCRENVLVKLEIPADAKRSNAAGRKCRAEFVRVLEIIGADVAISQQDGDFIYRAGEIVRCSEPFDQNRWEECSSGIHFFITKAEAEAWI